MKSKIIPKQKFLTFAFLVLTTIVSAQIPAYYNDVNLNLTGTALKNELATKITNTHTNTLTYSQVWDAIKNTDEDPNNSANVLLIYGYSDVDGNYVTDKTRSKTLNGGTAGTQWNREHSYAKSLGTPNLGTSGPGADAHHLRASDITMNSNRGSLKYITGSGNAGATGSGWYPGDEWKGDVARMMMYMYLRYGSRCLPSNVAIGTANASDANMIDLLLQWNVDDPVSPFETQRNVYLEDTNNTFAQGNRNPFIDNPAFATQIWGGPQAEDKFATGPEIDVQGNSISIASGTTTTSLTNDTNFGTVATASGTIIKTFTILNNGTSVLTLASLPSISGTNAADFTLTANPSLTIAAGSTTTFSITFDPSADGARTATITINNDDANEGTYTFNIEGTGIPPGPEIDIQGNATSIASGSTTTSVSDDTDFGSVDTTSGTIVKTFTVLNQGTSLLTLSGNPTISGANAADFTITANPTLSIAASASTTFSITFNPSADGVRNATITLLNDDTNEGTYTFNITGTGTTAGAGCNELFFSEYIEGSGNNKYLEIYNPTASPIDLAAGSYDIVTYTNGSATISNTLALSGTIAAYGTFVVENSAEALAVTADLSTTNAVMTFNGNDAVVLRKATVNIDVIGQIGFDPGTQWSGVVCTTGTANGGIRRNATVNTGDTNGADTFDPDVEWTCVGTDIVTDLGVYTNNCASTSPEIDVQGNSVSIASGSTVTSASNDTDFGAVSTASGTIVKTFTILNTGTGSLTLSGNPSISGTNAADFTVTANPNLTIAAAASTTFSVTFNPSVDGVRNATITINNDDTNEGTYTFNISGTGAGSGVGSNPVSCATSSGATVFQQDFEAAPAAPILTYVGTSTTTSTGNGNTPAAPKYVSGTQGIQISNTVGTIEFATVDVSAQTNPEFSIRLASFSGTSGNGAETTDYVKLFISTDGGTTYSEEVTVTGAAANNARWSFTSGTGIATAVYDGNNTTTTFAPAGTGDRTTDGYSTLKVTGLPSSTTLRIKIEAKNNSTNEQWVFDDAKIIGSSQSLTTWAGSWDNNTPQNNVKAIINGDYSGVSIETCECEVKSGSTLTVSAGNYMKIEGNLVNNGTIIVEDGASLIQVSSSATISGSGTFIVKRNSVSLPSEHVYTYWSSPLTNSTLAEVVPNADSYYSFSAGAQNWVAAGSGTNMLPGIGYITKGPTDGSFPGTYLATFTGSNFNNGDISVGLTFNNDADADNDWNLVGNPYPSAISATDFINANPTIGGTIYFWTHNTDASFTQNFSQNDYVSWNGSGGIAGCGGCTAPTGSIASGQGFFVQALSASNVTFTNAVRETGSNTNFYRTGNTTAEKNKIWLNLFGENSFSQLLVGFFDQATDNTDRVYDGLRLDGGAKSNFYSIIDDKPYGIQGKSSLKETEDIPLGFKITDTGTFTISIDHFEGVLNASEVYLIDNELNIQHNLKDSDYTFTINNAGTNDTRFTLYITTSTEALDIDEEIASTKLIITGTQSLLQVKADNNSIINKVVVYDLLGKEVALSKKPATAIRLQSSLLKTNSIFIVKAILDSGEIVVTKIYKN